MSQPEAWHIWEWNKAGVQGASAEGVVRGLRFGLWVGSEWVGVCCRANPRSIGSEGDMALHAYRRETCAGHASVVQGVGGQK